MARPLSTRENSRPSPSTTIQPCLQRPTSTKLDGSRASSLSYARPVSRIFSCPFRAKIAIGLGDNPFIRMVSPVAVPDFFSFLNLYSSVQAGIRQVMWSLCEAIYRVSMEPRVWYEVQGHRGLSDMCQDKKRLSDMSPGPRVWATYPSSRYGVGSQE